MMKQEYWGKRLLTCPIAVGSDTWRQTSSSVWTPSLFTPTRETVLNKGLRALSIIKIQCNHIHCLSFRNHIRCSPFHAFMGGVSGVGAVSGQIGVCMCVCVVGGAGAGGWQGMGGGGFISYSRSKRSRLLTSYHIFKSTCSWHTFIAICLQNI